MKTVIVTGGRDYEDRQRVWEALDAARPDLLVVGDATGADAWARSWAHSRGVRLEIHAADWQVYGRRAGPLRNGAMLGSHPDAVVVAFPGGRGTADCVRQARRAGMSVVEVG